MAVNEAHRKYQDEAQKKDEPIDVEENIVETNMGNLPHLQRDLKFILNLYSKDMRKHQRAVGWGGGECHG